jgi:outer membrane lipoprotein-sorting protein
MISAMKKLILAAAAISLLCVSALAQGNNADLKKVFDLLDKSSEHFQAVQARFEWDQYQKVVDEHDQQSGTMYFKRTPAGVDVAADITKPIEKKLVFKNGVVELYTPKTGQTEHHEAGKNRKSFESFLALGFGGTSRDLQKNFDVSYAGTETVNGHPTYKLELTPKEQQVRNMFPHITLWINQQNGMSEQQKLDQGEGDYRLARYANITLNPPKLPENAFLLKGK